MLSPRHHKAKARSVAASCGWSTRAVRHSPSSISASSKVCSKSTRTRFLAVISLEVLFPKDLFGLCPYILNSGWRRKCEKFRIPIQQSYFDLQHPGRSQNIDHSKNQQWNSTSDFEPKLYLSSKRHLGQIPLRNGILKRSHQWDTAIIWSNSSTLRAHFLGLNFVGEDHSCMPSFWGHLFSANQLSPWSNPQDPGCCCSSCCCSSCCCSRCIPSTSWTQYFEHNLIGKRLMELNLVWNGTLGWEAFTAYSLGATKKIECVNAKK